MRVTNYVVALILAYISLSESDAAAIVEPSDSKVKSVEFVNFQSFISSQPLVLMQFYTEWNGFSRDLAPKFREAAAQLAAANLQRPVILAKYDDSTEEQRKLRAGAADVYNFHSYPALVVFDQGKPQRYSGGLEVADIVSYMTAVSKGQIMSTEHKPGTGLFESMPSYDEDVLTELSPEQFESIVLGEKHALWIVCVYSESAASRAFTTTLLGAAKDALGNFPGRARFGAINANRIVPGSAPAGRLGVVGTSATPRVISLLRGVRTGEAAQAALSGGDGLARWLAERISLYGSVADKPAAADAAAAAPAAAESATAGGFKLAAATNATAAAAGDVTVPEVPKFGGFQFAGNLSWREVIGRHTWFLIHSAAAVYPDAPSDEDVQAMRFLFASLGQHYPCKICKHHLQTQLGKGPPRLIDDSSRRAVSVWACELHNEVTRMKGKPMMDCGARRLDLMYRQEPKECDAASVPPAAGWNAVEWERDPAAHRPEAPHEEGWRLDDVEALLAKAAEYNVLSEDKAAGIRSAAAAGEQARAEAVAGLNLRLRRVLRLEARARHLERRKARPA